MRPRLHVVRFKYSFRFHPSQDKIRRRTERDFPTVQINTCHIYSAIASSNRGIRQDKIILKCTNIGSDRKCKLTTTIKFYLQSRAMMSPDHLDIERMHMTSWQTYWCFKTMTQPPCWLTKPTLWEFNFFLM